MVKYIDNSVEILYYPDNMVERIAKIARISHGGKVKLSDQQLVKKLIEWGHHSALEHGGLISVKLVVSRGCATQITRHRLTSIMQESTRYVKYDELMIIGEKSELYEDIERMYLKNRDNLDYVKYILPQATATTLIVSANPREWRHILSLRTTIHAHFEVRKVMETVLEEFKKRDPIIWE